LKTQEFRDLKLDELREKERELGQELFSLRFQKATGQLSNTAAVGKTRRELARVKTVIRENEMKGDPYRG
jgi:large subunit ribosomal protein L29